MLTKKQFEMIRVARVNNEFEIDRNHQLNGRGAYVCHNSNCINLTIKKRLLNKSFKTNIDTKIYDKLGEYEQNN